MANIVNERDIALQATVPRLISTSVTISSAGGSGFTKTKNTNTLTPTSMTLNIATTGFTSASKAWYYASSTSIGTFNTVAEATVLGLTSANFLTHLGTGTFVRYKCVASQFGWTTVETYFDVSYTEQVNDLPVLSVTKDNLALPTTSEDICTYTDAYTEIDVSIGGVIVPYAASGNNTYSVAIGTIAGTTTITPSTIVSTRRLTISGMNGTGLTAVASVPITITVIDSRGTTTIFNKSLAISKVTSGSVGNDAVFIDLQSESDVFPAANDGTGYGTIPANTIRIYKGGALQTATSYGCGATAGTQTATSNGLTATVVVGTGAVSFSGTWSADSALFTFNAVYNGITYTTNYTLAKSRVGTDAVYIDLLSEVGVFNAANDGTGYGTIPANTIRIYKGGALQTATSYGCGATAGTQTATSNGLTATVVVGTGAVSFSGTWSADSALFTFNAVYNGITYTRVYSLSKSKVGTAGGAGQVKGVSFLRSVSAPATPTGGSYSDPTATSWSDGIPADNNQPLWMTTRLFTSNGLAPQQSVWTTPSKIGTPSTGAKVQFSPDNINWYDTPSTNDYFMRSGTSTDNGVTWNYSGSVKIKGEVGPASTVAGPEGPTGAQIFTAYGIGANSSTPPHGAFSSPGTTTNGAAPTSYSLTVPTGLTGVQAQFQTTGTQPAGSTTTTWSIPFLSYFKVGSLAAVSANMGTVAIDTTGKIYSGTKSSYASAEAGFFLGYDSGFFLGYDSGYKFKIGTSTINIGWDGSNLTGVGAIFTGGAFQTSSVYPYIRIDGPSNSMYGGSSTSYTFNLNAGAGTFVQNSDLTAAADAEIGGGAGSKGAWNIVNSVGVGVSGYGALYGGYFRNYSSATGVAIFAEGTIKATTFQAKGGTGSYFSDAANYALLSGTLGVVLAKNNVGALVVDDTTIRPHSNNTKSLGTAAYLWTTVYATTGTINTSDRREKQDIKAEALGLSFINDLYPVSYKWKAENLPGIFHGLIAQDVKKVLTSHGVSDFAGWTLAIRDKEDSAQGLRYTEFIGPLIKSVQELSEKVTYLEYKIKELENGQL